MTLMPQKGGPSQTSDPDLAPGPLDFGPSQNRTGSRTRTSDLRPGPSQNRARGSRFFLEPQRGRVP